MRKADKRVGKTEEQLGKPNKSLAPKWSIDPHYNWVRKEDGSVIANCTGYNKEEGLRNCVLIALAPKMLKTLKALLELEFDTDNDDYESLKPVLDMVNEIVTELEDK